MEELVHDVEVVLDVSPLRDSADRLKSVAVLKHGGTLISLAIDFPFAEEVLADLARK